MSYYIASCSFGKDSLAMVLRLIEENKPLDEIIFYDTGMEFEAVYKVKEKAKVLFEKSGVKFTELKPERPFLYDAIEKPIKNRFGYGWCGGCARWGTAYKTLILDNYKSKYDNRVEYVGIAFDEMHRKKGLVYPLIEWQMTEADCLKYCRDKGFSWFEKTPRTESGYIDLYTILDRVSCWCCANKNAWELWNMWYYLPNYWEGLKQMQSRIEMPMKKLCNKKFGEYGNIFELEKVFESGYVPKHRVRKDD